MRRSVWMLSCLLVAACGKVETQPDAADPCAACVAAAACDPSAAAPCMCPQGQQGDGTIAGTGCMTIDACTDADPCVANATCTDDGAGGATCACPTGFDGDGTTAGSGCTDIDECSNGVASCGEFDCVNDPGTFHCAMWIVAAAQDGALRRVAHNTVYDAIGTTNPAGAAFGYMSMAVDPADGRIYAVEKVDATQGSARSLVTIDPSNGAAATIGALGLAFASLAFDGTGQLWGVTGASAHNASAPETLFQIDKATGATTLVEALTPSNGGTGSNQGDCILYDPDDNVFFRLGGNAPTQLTRIDLNAANDPETVLTTNIFNTTSTGHEPFGCSWDPARHAIFELDIQHIMFSIDPTALAATQLAVVGQPGIKLRSAFSVAPTDPHVMSPANGPLAGGTTITLTGDGMDLQGAAPTVTINGVPATAVTVVDSHTVTAVTPAGTAAGTYDVLFNGTTGQYTWPQSFTYQ